MSIKSMPLKMRCLAISAAVSSSLLLGAAIAQDAPASASAAPTPATTTSSSQPQAGSWEISAMMKGVPSGDEKITKKACLTATQVSSGFEQALLDNIASGSSRGGLKCTVKDIKRDGTKATWPASCEGPRGPMKGTGGGTFEAVNASMSQVFEVKTPFGAMKLEQVIQAKRLGDC